jgi:chemotaxis response regulator CheB
MARKSPNGKTLKRPATRSRRKPEPAPRTVPRTSQRHVPAAAPEDGPMALDAGAAAGPDVPTVVGVGASAGGLEAFSQLLESLPDGADVALVFVQHLSPQHESALPALLAARTRLPLVQVTEGLRIEPRHVYVIPPNVQMDVRNGVLHLLPRPYDRSQYTPVDHFFKSLAGWAGSRAVGVILSGTASGRHRGHSRHQGVGRHHHRPAAGNRQVRRDAASRDRHRPGRSGAVTPGDRRTAR